ncbi:uncharacterized protein F5147DRAFT_658832 [Suillus discolor]|uniref:Uncharacterized protein n=1 Tax=Suillus discolor TaxID=1912936 RepID=A0A9P7ES50_9AGAM|nr:uncharacterized protein F5147DRAFT_658832 [Suillus discolor]KAG2087895.1 hypothetical protein F5147DRAFT_658832 [Suillus discolor]
MPNAEFSNTAMGDAAEQLMKIVQKAAKLRDGHPNHLKLAVEIGDLMSLVFKTHAAMEMLEHLDAAQQSFASAPVWARIRTDDPQIQQHPLKEKAHSITIAKPTAAANTSTTISGMPAPAKVKPKPKPMPMPKTKRRMSRRSRREMTQALPEGIHHWHIPPLRKTKTSKWPKVTRESVSLKHNAPKEDITTDMAPQAPNFELVAIAPDKNLNVLMPKPTSVNKAEHDPAHATGGWQKHPQMDVDDSHDGLMKVLEGMTLEVMQDSANLSARNATLQEIANTLRTNIAQLTAENTTTTEQLNALQDRITAQDAALLELQGLQAEVTELHSQVKTLREESATRDQHLQRAQHQLGQQERTTAVLQDAYNAIHQCLTGPPNSSSPFTNSLYLANPMYGGGQSMVLVSMGQMQAMEGLYFNLPSLVGNISSGSMLGGPSAGPSVSTIASSTHTRGDTKGGAPSGVGNEPGNRYIWVDGVRIIIYSSSGQLSYYTTVITDDQDHFLPLLGFGASTIAALLRVLLAGVSLIDAAARRFPERVVGTNDVNSFAAFVAFAALEAGGLSTVTRAFVCLAPAELVEECNI